jgi:hypothetical protein
MIRLDGIVLESTIATADDVGRRPVDDRGSAVEPRNLALQSRVPDTIAKYQLALDLPRRL